MKKTRIAVAGAGCIGQAHIGVVQQSTTCVLSAVVDPSPAARAHADAAGVPLYTSLAELLAGDKPDGVILATPNQLHVTHALECIAAGVPMLLEKPIAPTVPEAERLVAAAESADAKILIGHHRAHSPIMAKARQVVESGVLGRLVAVTGSATFLKPDHYYADAPWRREPGAGPILLNMIHEVHSLRMLCGEIVAVQAFASHATRGFAVEDTVAINLRFASGALGSFMLSDTAACCAQLGADLAGEQVLPELWRRGLLRHCRHKRQPVGPDDAAEDLSARRRPLVVEAVRGRRRQPGARRPAQAPARALRCGRAR